MKLAFIVLFFIVISILSEVVLGNSKGKSKGKKGGSKGKNNGKNSGCVEPPPPKGECGFTQPFCCPENGGTGKSGKNGKCKWNKKDKKGKKDKKDKKDKNKKNKRSKRQAGTCDALKAEIAACVGASTNSNPLDLRGPLGCVQNSGVVDSLFNAMSSTVGGAANSGVFVTRLGSFFGSVQSATNTSAMPLSAVQNSYTLLKQVKETVPAIGSAINLAPMEADLGADTPVGPTEPASVGPVPTSVGACDSVFQAAATAVAAAVAVDANSLSPLTDTFASADLTTQATDLLKQSLQAVATTDDAVFSAMMANFGAILDAFTENFDSEALTVEESMAASSLVGSVIGEAGSAACTPASLTALKAGLDAGA